MPRFAADENFNNAILGGLLRRLPNLDIVRVQDVGLAGIDDPIILDWAAGEERVIMTHDAQTMAGFAYERLEAGLHMPGLLEVRRSVPVGQAIEIIMTMIEAGFESDWVGQVRYLIR